RVRGQPHMVGRSNQFDVDIEVVLLLSVPGKGHLIAVRGKARRSLKPRVAGERHHFGCGLRFCAPSSEEPSSNSYRYEIRGQVCSYASDSNQRFVQKELEHRHRSQETVPSGICQALICSLFVLTSNCQADSLRLFVGSTRGPICGQFSGTRDWPTWVFCLRL